MPSLLNAKFIYLTFADKTKPDASFSEKLSAQIVNNMQLKITNVHIRYEDALTTNKPIAFGATLHRLELYTTDRDWIKSYITEQVSRVYKVANLDSLAVYMNSKTELFSALDPSDLPEKFCSTIATSEVIPPYYTYGNCFIAGNDC